MFSRSASQAVKKPRRRSRHCTFEEGSGPFDLERIGLFAEATDSDPFAIVASVWLRSPEFALRSIDAKPMVVMMLAMHAFHEEIGEDIGLIEPRVWWGGFRRLFQDMADHVRKRDLSAEIWLDDEARRLGLRPSFTPQGRWRKPPPDENP